jgi:hypothetical protein
VSDDGEVEATKLSSEVGQAFSKEGSLFSKGRGQRENIKIVLILGRLGTFRNVRFEVFTAVTMKNGIFWDVTPCGSCKNRLFGGT